MILFKKTVLNLLIILLPSLVFAQITDGNPITDLQRDSLTKANFKSILNRQNLKFSMPKGYKRYYIPKADIGCTDKNSFLYTLHVDNAIANVDSTIVIVLSIWGGDSTKNIRGFAYDRSNSWRRDVERYADTTKASIIYFNKNELKKFNATGGAQFKVKCKQLNHYGYTIYEGIMLHKKNKGTAEIYFLYKNKGVENIDREIQKSRELLKYKK